MTLREFIDSTRVACEEIDAPIENDCPIWLASHQKDAEFIFKARTALPLALEMLEIASRVLEDINDDSLRVEQHGSGEVRWANTEDRAVMAHEALAEMAKKLEKQ